MKKEEDDEWEINYSTSCRFCTEILGQYHYTRTPNQAVNNLVCSPAPNCVPYLNPRLWEIRTVNPRHILYFCLVSNTKSGYPDSGFWDS
jgi:hypothetical protein